MSLIEKVKEIISQEALEHKDWDKLTKELLELQKEWKSIGHVPKDSNEKIWNDFRGLFDNPEVHAFEPDTENFEYLRKFCEKLENTTINNVGVSESNGELVLYRNAKSSTSSFSPLNKSSDWVKLRCAERGISSDKFTEQEYKVDVIDLDSYVRKKHITRIDLLKIDTQTHEDKVLDGCKNTLKKGIIKVIEIEVIVGDVYTRSLNISDIEMRLLKFGYKFYGINRAGNLLNAPWVDFDMIYVHNTLL